MIILIVASLILVVAENYKSFTGFATEGTTTSNVTISKALSIAFSANLSEGIYFGNVTTLPATDINATHNYDGNPGGVGTSYYIAVSNDSNTNVDFCVRANTGLTSATADVIGLANETYSNSTSTTVSIPTLASQVPMTTSYVKAGSNIVVGSNNYYRFFLDVPGAQPTGDYNNSVSFKGVVTALSC